VSSIRRVCPCLLHLTLLLFLAPYGRTTAAEIVGEVFFAQDTTLMISITPGVEPAVGSTVEIFVDVPGVGAARVATARVSHVSKDTVMAEVIEASGKVLVGQKAHFLNTTGDASKSSVEENQESVRSMLPGGSAGQSSATTSLPSKPPPDTAVHEGSQSILPALATTGTGPGYLGMLYREPTRAEVQAVGLDQTIGIWVHGVQPGSAADLAGIQPGDLVTSIDGQEVSCMYDLSFAVSERGPGTRVKLEVVRDAGKTTRTAVLTVRPNSTETIRRFEILAERDIPWAMYALGRLFLRSSDDTEPDPEKAYSWLRKAADAGDAQAMGDVGRCYAVGCGVEKNADEAIRWFERAIEAGAPHGEFSLGEMYEEGWSVPVDMAEAARWYRKSAGKDHHPAHYKLGRAYEFGAGVRKDLAEAVRWYAQGAEGGNADAEAALAMLYGTGQGVARNYERMLELNRRAAKKGSLRAIHNIGAAYRRGWGVRQDVPEAVRWFRKAAEAGFPASQHNMGLAYSDGWHDEVDLDQAFGWFEKAAQAGIPGSQYEVGRFWESGQVLPRNDQTARQWYAKAADNGYADAMVELGRFYENGTGVPQDNRMAFEWYHKAAQAKNPRGQHAVGMMCYHGKGVQRDYGVALQWLELAAKSGHAESQATCGFMCQNGLGTQQDIEAAVKWYRQAAQQGNQQAINNLEAMGLSP
jgi:TPR repeat protein